MTCLRIPKGTLCVGGDIHIIVDETGRRWRFEDHHYCGPSVVNRRGEPVASQPGERSPYWRAVLAWIDQGRLLDVDGVCFWQKPLKPVPYRDRGVWWGGNDQHGPMVRGDLAHRPNPKETPK